MLTTLIVSAGSKVLGAFGSKKAASPISPSAGIQMRSETVMEKKLTNDSCDSVEEEG